jgi:sec-independent protein translocase protein TatC
MLFRLLKKLFEKREDAKKEDGEVVKPFLDHLEDLRWTIIKMSIVLLVMVVVCFVFAHELFKFLQLPMIWAGMDPHAILRNNAPFASILAGIQLSFYAAITLSFPILMYFLGEFVFPALTKKEKKAVFPALGIGFGLFLGGVAFCFMQVLPGMLRFLSDYAAKSGFVDMWDVKTYYAFIAHLCIAFGLLCELPVLMVTLNFIGVVSYKLLAGTRAYGMTAILVLCAIVSPSPDLATLFMLAAPILLLYEGCIWIIYYLDKRRAKREAEEEAKFDRPYDDKNEPID